MTQKQFSEGDPKGFILCNAHFASLSKISKNFIKICLILKFKNFNSRWLGYYDSWVECFNIC